MVSQAIQYPVAGVPSSERTNLPACGPRQRQRSGTNYPHSSSFSPGLAFLAKGLRAVFGPEEIEPLLARRQDSRITTSKLLPEVLRLKGEGLTYARIGQRLGLTARQVEHVLSRHRKHSGQ